MTPIRIFISSVQREFAREREQLRDYLRGDPLMRRFFDVLLFEDVPASDRRPDRVYLDEVGRCDIYVGLFGRDYGSEDAGGVSPTEREFDCATELEKHRLIFVKGAEDGDRDPRMRALIARSQAGLVRRRFATSAELVTGVYAALVQYLESKELLRFGPFDAAPCSGATLDDLDVEGMYRFIRIARRARKFPLPAETPPEDLLRHLNLLNKGRLTNAAMLLFGKAPQRFLISSEIKCAHFHGTAIAKPIPSYQVYKGTVFALVDQAVGFVLDRIALSVGTRAQSVQAPVAYELPKEVVTEAIVNAVAHRDYTDNSSVQVMLFADRLEVMNSGRLPPSLTVERLREPHQSLPGNPLLAESMYLLRYIERMGTGTVDMIRHCAEAGLPEPEFEAGAGFVTRIWRKADARTSVSTRATDRDAGIESREDGQDAAATQETTQKTAKKSTSPTQIATQKTTREKILACLAAEPGLTRIELAERIGVTPDGIKYHLRNLKEHRYIRRVGSDRAGHWEITERLVANEPTAGTQPEGPGNPAATQNTAGTTPETTQKTTRKSTPPTHKLTQKTTRERILDCLEADPAVTRRELAERIGVTPDAIKYHLRNLKADGKIRRVGSDRAGRWEVLR